MISRYRLSREIVIRLRSVCLQLICSVCHSHSFSLVCLFSVQYTTQANHMPIGLLLSHIFHVYLSGRFDLHCNKHFNSYCLCLHTRCIINSSIHHTRTHNTAPLHSLRLRFLLLLSFFSLFMVHIHASIYIDVQLRTR